MVTEEAIESTEDRGLEFALELALELELPLPPDRDFRSRKSHILMNCLFLFLTSPVSVVLTTNRRGLDRTEKTRRLLLGGEGAKGWVGGEGGC